MESLQTSLSSYEEQLSHIELAISSADSQTDKENLLSLKNDIQQLIDLTRESLNDVPTSSSTRNQNEDHFSEEYALFLSEIQKEETNTKNDIINTNPDINSLEGTKCRAPHKHNWGDIVYHNALICSVIIPENSEEPQVKVMFTNPTHNEMLPCPYFLDSECKFSVEQCRYSHGEIVPFASLKDYVEPNFESVAVGSKVLAKKSDKLWHRATVKRLLGEKCVVKFESIAKAVELDLHDVFPLDCDNDETDYSSTDSDDYDMNKEDVINTSLMLCPSDQALGSWEKHTKGIGSKLMAKMGYVVGTGLGRRAEGRIDPVTAVILPAGKSLDHCMKLRENAGGDKDLFNVERKMRRLQKKQEIRNQRAYEREKNKTDVFDFLNDKLVVKEASLPLKSDHRQEIKKETSRNLNVASLKTDEDIKRTERDLYKIRESLSRHKDINSPIHRKLKFQLNVKENELVALTGRAANIRSEQSVRSDKKKLTVF